MNAETITNDYHSKYISLLNKLNVDNNSLASLKVSILCFQKHKNSQIDENETVEIENDVCKHCLNPWTHGNFTLKTVKHHQNGTKLKRKHITSFKMIQKCMICFNVTSFIIKKNKLPKDRCTTKISESSTLVSETSTTKELPVNKTVNQKPKKKKRNLYAGLNPIVFKNRELLNKKKMFKT